MHGETVKFTCKSDLHYGWWP